GVQTCALPISDDRGDLTVRNRDVQVLYDEAVAVSDVQILCAQAMHLCPHPSRGTRDICRKTCDNDSQFRDHYIRSPGSCQPILWSEKNPGRCGLKGFHQPANPVLKPVALAWKFHI